MGTNTTNNHTDNGPAMAALGSVTVAGMFFALIFGMLILALVLGITYGTAHLGYKVYQLRVHRVISLAQIAAGQIPHPTLPIERQRRYPPPRELMWGRDDNG